MDLRRRSAQALRDRSGSTATTVALVGPLLIGIAAGGINFTLTVAERSRLQDIADAASTGAARELAFARADAEQIVAIATGYVRDRLGPGSTAAVSARVVVDGTGVAVDIGDTVQGTIPLPGVDGLWTVAVKSVAHVTAGPPICMIALDTKAPRTIYLEGSARLSADRCSVYSNSVSPQGISATQVATLNAALTCSAGGRVGGKINFTPEPLTDCPPVPDPLAERIAPQVGGCREVDKVVASGAVPLMPGTYCGGLKITGGAVATLQPGIYVIKDGPLTVEQGATLQGSNVGFYLHGRTAAIAFATASTIGLTAPRNGTMAGFLIFEDRDAPDLREHRIMSDNAHTLLGTIYLSKGRLVVDASRPIAAKSAYTIIVTRRMELYAGPNLVLNTDYDSTDIPVPEGVGRLGGKVRLTD